jgi:hypothetical protein
VLAAYLNHKYNHEDGTEQAEVRVRTEVLRQYLRKKSSRH